MKQYDRVWVPDENGEYGAYLLCPEVSAEEIISPKENVICLTIEELREICRAVVSEWVEIKPAGSVDADIDKDLHNYLTSKGITI